MLAVMSSRAIPITCVVDRRIDGCSRALPLSVGSACKRRPYESTVEGLRLDSATAFEELHQTVGYLRPLSSNLCQLSSVHSITLTLSPLGMCVTVRASFYPPQ